MRGRGARARRVWPLVVVGVIVLLLAGVTVAALPLTSDELTIRLRSEIAKRLPPELGLTLARASLAVSREGLVVEIEDVALAEASAAMASVDALSVTLNPFALLAQRIEPRRLTFEGPSLVLPKGEAWDYDLSGEAVSTVLGRAMRVLSGLEDQIDTTEISVRGAALTLASGTMIEDIDLVAGRDGPTRRLYVEGRAGPRRVMASLERLPEGDRIRIELGSDEETITFGADAPKTIELSKAVLRLDASMTEDGLTGEALGRIAGVGPDGRGFVLELPCALFNSTCRTDALRVGYGESGGTFAGELGFPQGLSGAPRFDLHAEDLVLAETDRAEHVHGAALELRGSLLAMAPGMHLDAATLTHPEGHAALSGRMIFGARTPELFLDIASQGARDGFVKQVWPRFLARNTRAWVLDHVLDGRIANAAGALRLPADALARTYEGVPLDAGAIDVALDFAGAHFDYVDGLPEVEGADGVLRLGSEVLDIVLASGTATLPGGSLKAKIASGRFSIPDVRAAPPVASIEIAAKADAPFVYRIGGPLTEAVGALPSGMRGALDARINLTVPLGENIDYGSLAYDAVIGVADGFVPDVYAGKALRDGTFIVRANAAGFDVGGTATLSGLPLRLALFGSPDVGIEAFSATASEDVGVFRRLDIDMTDYVEGSSTATITGTDPAAGVETLTVDFTDAAVTLPVRGLIKPAGAPASMTARVAESGGTTRLTALDVDATTFRARGRLDIDARSDLDLILTDYTLGREDGGSLRLRTRGDSTTIAIDADRADGRPAMDWLFSDDESTAPGAGSTSIEISAASLLGYDGRSLRDLTLQVDVTGDRAALLSGNATLPGGASVRVQMREGGAGGLVELSAGDAGEVLRFVDIYERVRGGELGIEANLSEDGATFGSLSIWDFEIADEVGLEVLTREAENERRGSMAFDRLRVPFSHADGQIEIGEGFVRGPVAGATFTGRLDLARDTLAIRGTFVPLYALNNVFSRVPIVGNILGNRRREGLWGITFAMDGPIDGPTLRVNPLSAVAPGIFRSIFEFAPPSARATGIE